jgi:hypothetical protein
MTSAAVDWSLLIDFLVDSNGSSMQITFSMIDHWSFVISAQSLLTIYFRSVGFCTIKRTIM